MPGTLRPRWEQRFAFVFHGCHEWIIRDIAFRTPDWKAGQLQQQTMKANKKKQHMNTDIYLYTEKAKPAERCVVLGFGCGVPERQSHPSKEENLYDTFKCT